MKKVFRVIAAAIVSVALVGSAASAQSQGNNIVITGTGPGSNNTVTYNNVSNVTYTCNNNVLALNFNNQDGTTGSATVDFNTSAGAAVSGAVSNTNVTSTNIASVCAAATPVASTTPTPTPVVPGQGAAAPAPKPKALPYTASNSALTIVIASLVAAAAVVVASRLAVAAYRRIGTK